MLDMTESAPKGAWIPAPSALESLPRGTSAEQVKTVLAGGHHSKSDLSAARILFVNKVSNSAHVDFPRRKGEKAVDIIDNIADTLAFLHNTGPRPSFIPDDDDVQTPSSSPSRKTARGNDSGLTHQGTPRRLSFTSRGADANQQHTRDEDQNNEGETSLHDLSLMLKSLATTVANQTATISESLLREDIQKEIRKEMSEVVRVVESKIVERLATIEAEALEAKLKLEQSTAETKRTNIRLEELQAQIESLEQDRRKSNILISGLPQRGKRPAEVVSNFLEHDLKVTSVTPLDVLTIRNALHPDQPRLLVKLQTPAEKFLILRSCKALRGRDISVSEDLTPKQQARRKELVPELRRRRKAGEIVFLRGDRLFIKDHENASPRMITDLQASK